MDWQTEISQGFRCWKPRHTLPSLPPRKGVFKWPQTDGYQHFPHAKWKVCEVETKYAWHLLPRVMKPCTSKPLCGPVRCSLWLCGELERCLPWAFIIQLLYFTFWVTQASASQRKASGTFQKTAQRPSEIQGVPNIDTWFLWCPLGTISRQQHTEACLSDADVSAETNILSAISSFPPTAYQQPFYILHVDYFIWPQDLFSHGNFIIKARTKEKNKNHHQRNESQRHWSCLSALFILMQAFEGSASALL